MADKKDHELSCSAKELLNAVRLGRRLAEAEMAVGVVRDELNAAQERYDEAKKIWRALQDEVDELCAD